MAFPITHLLVADALLTRRPRADAAQFMLGALAPDAVHYREGFVGAAMSNIGQAKKVTHLCPVNDEPWGSITLNEDWIQCVKGWMQNNAGLLSEGYAVHILTDIYNNLTLWERFRVMHPAQAAKGYASDYYRDLQEIDLKLYLSHVQGTRIEQLLENAKPCDMPGLVSAGELGAIRDNILYENYKGRNLTAGYEYGFVTYNETLDFISDATDAILSWQEGCLVKQNH